MKMEHADPAGFLPKWLYMFSMHIPGKKRPESLLFFNYTIKQVCVGGGVWWHARHSRARRIPEVTSSSSDNLKGGMEGSQSQGRH